MSALLQPLSFMVYRRQSVIATASLQFMPAESRRGGARVGLIQSLPSIEKDNLLLGILDDKVDGTEQEQRYTVQQKSEEPIFVETKYGIRLEVANEDQQLIDISETLTKEVIMYSDEAKPARYHYQLYPDWHTSYLWYDLKYHSVGGPHVDLEVIEERYPTLSPYYKAWRQIYETSFKKQECDLGSGAEVFPDVDDFITWSMEGFFLACWLALRDNVHSVEYIPKSKKYVIERETVDRVLLEFLRDLATERKTIEQS